jgi:hypothetical protein
MAARVSTLAATLAAVWREAPRCWARRRHRCAREHASYTHDNHTTRQRLPAGCDVAVHKHTVQHSMLIAVTRYGYRKWVLPDWT